MSEKPTGDANEQWYYEGREYDPRWIKDKQRKAEAALEELFARHLIKNVDEMVQDGHAASEFFSRSGEFKFLPNFQQLVINAVTSCGKAAEAFMQVSLYFRDRLVMMPRFEEALKAAEAKLVSKLDNDPFVTDNIGLLSYELQGYQHEARIHEILLRIARAKVRKAEGLIIQDVLKDPHSRQVFLDRSEQYAHMERFEELRSRALAGVEAMECVEGDKDDDK